MPFDDENSSKWRGVSEGVSYVLLLVVLALIAYVIFVRNKQGLIID